MRRISIGLLALLLASTFTMGSAWAARTPTFTFWPKSDLYDGGFIHSPQAKHLKRDTNYVIDECNGNFEVDGAKACSMITTGAIDSGSAGEFKDEGKLRVAEGPIGTDGGVCDGESNNDCSIALIPLTPEGKPRVALAIDVQVSFRPDV